MIKIDDWKKNIQLRKRARVFVRDWCIQNIYNPYQIFRRRRGWSDGDLFQHILIQTNYLCTRRCHFCHFGLDASPPNVDMDEALFCNIIDQLQEIRYSGRIGPFEMNEPLTDSRLPKFLRYARQHVPAAWLIITTNGDLLNEKILNSFFNDGLNHLYLNSYDQKALFHNSALLQKIHPNLRKRITHLNRTYQTDWTSRGGNIKRFQRAAVKGPCDMVYRVMYIKPTGKVYSCYNDFFDVNEMGDLNQQSLLDVWFGKAFTALRRQLTLGRRSYSRLCGQCDYGGYHSLPNVPLSWRVQRFTSRGFQK